MPNLPETRKGMPSVQLDEAQALHEAAAGPGHVLLINGSFRSEHICPGEMSKSFRLLEMARAVLNGGALKEPRPK